LEVEISQALDRLAGNQGRVAREHDYVILSGTGFSGHHQRMARPALLFLQHELNASVPDGVADLIGFVPDDGVDILCRDHFDGSGDHVSEKRLASNFVKDFWMFRLQARAFAGGHDRDGNAGSLQCWH
jgi:hypothetical protein